MKRLISWLLKISITISFLLIGGCLILFYFLGAEIADYLTAQIAAQARQEKVFLNFTQSNLGVGGLSAKNLDLEIHRGDWPTLLNIQDLKIKPAYLEIISGSPAVAFEFLIFSGRGSGKLVYQDRSLRIKNFALQNVNLNEIPQLAFFGVSAGQVSIFLKSLIVGKEIAFEGLEIDGQGLSKPKPSSLPARLTSLPLDIYLEPIEIKRFKLQAEGKNSIIKKSFQMQSSWADLTVPIAEVQFIRRRPRIQKLAGKVQLTDQGLKNFGAFLPLISFQKLTAENRDFDFNFVGYMQDSTVPAFDFTPH